MKADLQTPTKTSIISLILCLVSIGLTILENVIAPNYDLACIFICAIVVISVIALIMAIVALRKHNTKILFPIMSIVIASLFILSGGIVILDRLLAAIVRVYFMSII